MNDLALLALIHAHDLPRRSNRPTAGDWADVLAAVPLFTGVSKRRARKLARHARVAEFAPGETVISAGDPDKFLYVVLGGKAEALSKPAGRTLRTGDYFGDIALIDGRPRSATVVATSELHVMEFPPRRVLKLARHYPAIALTMLENLTRQLRHLESYRATSLASGPCEAGVGAVIRDDEQPMLMALLRHETCVTIVYDR
jgi:CRP/FNR family transcriptional regulator, cyclic AMP receptor protein